MSLRPLSNSVPSIINKVCGRKFILLGRVLSQWERIVGKDLAEKAKPVKIGYRKARGNSNEKIAVLELAVCSADSLLIQHQIGIITEKINMVLGEGVIGDIKIVHSASYDERENTMGKRQSGKALFAEKDLTNEQKSNLSLLLEGVDDPELKSKLESLGEGVIRKNRSR